MNNELGEYDLFEQGDKKKLAKWVTPDGHVMIGSVSYAAGFDFYAASVAAGESIGLKHAENAWDETGGSCLVECPLCDAIGMRVIEVRDFAQEVHVHESDDDYFLADPAGGGVWVSGEETDKNDDEAVRA